MTGHKDSLSVLHRRFTGLNPQSAGCLHPCPIHYLQVMVDRKFIDCHLRATDGSQFIIHFPGTLVETGGELAVRGLALVFHWRGIGSLLFSVIFWTPPACA
ncbi:hypothetical protein HAX54_005593 [Datura stramonium]|uniref:Uncharacterized protein n=1 Tax=Datura stramonium TaxID=4076 RepID=A0ABS8TBF9_DATST|nr:hypothetical protein [Datura stramonium]